MYERTSSKNAQLTKERRRPSLESTHFLEAPMESAPPLNPLFLLLLLLLLLLGMLLLYQPFPNVLGITYLMSRK